MFIESSAPRLQGEKAILQTSWMSVEDSQCNLTFWYHMLGDQIGSLEVRFCGPLNSPYYTEVPNFHCFNHIISLLLGRSEIVLLRLPLHKVPVEAQWLPGG